MTDWLAQHCRFSEEYNAAYRISSSATVGSQRKASLRYCPGQTTTILISGFSFARSKKRAEDLRRRSSALGAGDRTRTGTLSPAADFEWLYRFCFPQQSALHRSQKALILLAFDFFVFLLSKYGMSWCSLLTAQKSGLERTKRELRYNPFSREEWWT